MGFGISRSTRRFFELSTPRAILLSTESHIKCIVCTALCQFLKQLSDFRNFAQSLDP